MQISGSLMIPAISLIPSGGICMLHASICGPSVLGNFDLTEWKQHDLRRLWHTAVGCQTCAAGYAFKRNEPSYQCRNARTPEKDVSVLLFNYLVHCLSAAFLKIVKLVVISRMEMLREVYGDMSIDQRTEVVKWGKEQITQNYFNCTMIPPCNSKSSKK